MACRKQWRKISLQLFHQWSALVDYLRVSGDGLERDERDYLHKQREDINYRIFISAISRYGSWALLGASLPIAYFSPLPQRNIQLTAHMLVSAFMYLSYLYFKSHGAKPNHMLVQIYGLVMEFLWAAFYAYALNVALTSGANLTNVGFLSSLYVAIMIFNIILCPFGNGTVLLSYGFHIVLGVWAWAGVADLKIADWTVLLMFCATFAVTLFYSRLHRERWESLWHYRSRILAEQNKKLKLDAMNHELAIAQKIQDSFESPTQIHEAGRFSAYFFQKKYGALGGDWLACETLPTGELAILVADATGKGIQAALVVHAVQSLWALAMDQCGATKESNEERSINDRTQNKQHPRFDPVDWIHSVNRTLLRLGKTTPHTLTLGLLIISEQTLAFYSAAHVPLFAIETTDSAKPIVTPFLGRGSILGMGEVISVTPIIIPLKTLRADTLLFGTDGVFGKGSQNGSFASRRSVLQLYQGINEKGALVLDDLQIDDDKLLVVIKIIRPEILSNRVNTPAAA
jgi:serine phosphatase RsbU (regulator of sigma subunit)